MDTAAPAPPFPLILTDSARDKLEDLLIHENAQREQENALGLRVAIEGGGCAGFRYQFTFDEPEADDLRLEDGHIRVWVDPVSAGYLTDAELDYTSSLLASQFVLRNPQARGSCGCGQSVAL